MAAAPFATYDGLTARASWPHCQGGDAGVYTNRLKQPLGAILGHSCTLLRREDRTGGRGSKGVYTDWRKWPLGAVLGHSCTLLRREDRTGGRGSKGVYTDWLKWPLGAVLGHLCTLLRRGLGLWVALGSQ